MNSRGCFVMAYFTTEVEQLHLALSGDGLEWTPVNGGRPVLYGSVGTRTLRDPFIGADANGVFHLLATDGWASDSIVHSSSTDLVAWSEQRLIPVMAGVSGARNAWAPEFFAVADGGGYCVIWSSVVGETAHDARWEDHAWRSETTHDQRIWMRRTTDFVNWSAPSLFFDPGYPVIDATVRRAGDRYLMAFKDERGTNADPGGHKGIRTTWFDKVGGPYDEPSSIISGDPAEGPALFGEPGAWTLLFDRFLSGSFGGYRSTDGVDWRPVEALRVPPGARHASVLAIDPALAHRWKEGNTCTISES